MLKSFKGKIDAKQIAGVMASIVATKSYENMESTDIVVEAVVESEVVKKQVIKELEDRVLESTIIASNTSTISINNLAKNMKIQEDFGDAFFCPVHKMLLVEILEEVKLVKTLAIVVNYALKLKKHLLLLILPRFLVNRILFPI